MPSPLLFPAGGGGNPPSERRTRAIPRKESALVGKAPMKRKLVMFAVIVAVIGAAVFWFITMPASVPASALAPYARNLENGEKMFHAGGCASCHATPNQEDKKRLGGGLALKSPFGTFFPPNISPDSNDGIGSWRE